MRRALVVAAALSLSVVSPLAAAAADATRQKIAVLDVRAVQGVSPGTSDGPPRGSPRGESAPARDGAQAFQKSPAPARSFRRSWPGSSFTNVHISLRRE